MNKMFYLQRMNKGLRKFRIVLEYIQSFALFWHSWNFDCLIDVLKLHRNVLALSKFCAKCKWK